MPVLTTVGQWELILNLKLSQIYIKQGLVKKRAYKEVIQRNVMIETNVMQEGKLANTDWSIVSDWNTLDALDCSQSSANGGTKKYMI